MSQPAERLVGAWLSHVWPRSDVVLWLTATAPFVSNLWVCCPARAGFHQRMFSGISKVWFDIMLIYQPNFTPLYEVKGLGKKSAASKSYMFTCGSQGSTCNIANLITTMWKLQLQTVSQWLHMVLSTLYTVCIEHRFGIPFPFSLLLLSSSANSFFFPSFQKNIF